MERQLAARRTAVVIVFVYVLWMWGGRFIDFGSGIIQSKQRNDARAARREAAARQKKLSAGKLVQLLEAQNAVPSDSGLRCKPADRGWDYVCNYMPTPAQSRTRVRFGIAVDSERWLHVSPIVPMETDVPPPQTAG